MNSQDGLCFSVETNCFTKANPSESLFTADFGFGKILVINSTMESDLGKRYKIYGKHIELGLKISHNFQPELRIASRRPFPTLQ